MKNDLIVQLRALPGSILPFLRLDHHRSKLFASSTYQSISALPPFPSLPFSLFFISLRASLVLPKIFSRFPQLSRRRLPR